MDKEKCILTVWNSQAKENIFIDGLILNEIDGCYNEDFMRYDVKTKYGVYYGCHPNCVEMI